ncbi:MAG TPA: hypothetical protein VN442_00630 [Bryobacteraceae bacterium]|nr:hypothetical protein [Bryobacteraceae bacterium]
MWKAVLAFLTAAAAWGGADPWAKVQELKRGTEVRIYQTGQKRPITGKFDALSPESLIVVLKNEQLAIPRGKIERIDRRSSGSDVRTETMRHVGTRESVSTGRDRGTTLPPQSTSTGVRITPRPGFETVYQRP